MKHTAGDDSFLSYSSNFQDMSKSLGDFTNVKIKKRKREMVSDSDSDVSNSNRKKDRKNKLNGDYAQVSIQEEKISDVEDSDLDSKSKKRKKSKIRASKDETCESNEEESVKRKNREMSNGPSLVLMKKSSTDVEGEEINCKKSKKCIKEQFNCTAGEMFEEPITIHNKRKNTFDVADNESISEIKKPKKSKTRTDNEEIAINEDFYDCVDQKIRKTNKKNKEQANESIACSSNSLNDMDEEQTTYLRKINCSKDFSESHNEEPAKNNHKEFYREHVSSRRQSIRPPSAEYLRGLNKILSDFENKNESLKKVYCEDFCINDLDVNSPIFIFQVPIKLNPSDLVGKEIDVLNKKKTKTKDGKYTTTLSDEVEPIMLIANSQGVYLHPTHVVTFEKECNVDNYSETLNVPNFVNHLNIVDHASLRRRNPIIGLEKEDCERVLSSNVERKLKAAKKKYKKYKDKNIKKLLSTEDVVKQENIKNEEIFKYLSTPSQAI